MTIFSISNNYVETNLSYRSNKYSAGNEQIDINKTPSVDIVHDHVSISNVGKNVSSYGSETKLNNSISKMSDDDAYYFAEKLAIGIDGPMVSLEKASKGTGPVTYTATGEPVTDSSTEYLSRLCENVSNIRAEIYKNGINSGKKPQEILTEMVDFMNGQSEFYKNVTNWGGSIGIINKLLENK